MAQFVPTSFPQFRSLPPELRSLVWEAAFPGQRLLHFPRTTGSGPQLRIPAIAHACRESRHEYLTKEGKNIIRTRTGEWFNLKKDLVSLSIERHNCWKLVDEELKSHIKSIFLVDSGLSKSPNRLIDGTTRFFKQIMRSRTTLDTINIFPSGELLDFFHPSQLNDRVANLFGNNTVLSVNIQNKSECDNMIASLNTFEGAKKCAINLLEAYEIGMGRDLQGHMIDLFKYKWIYFWHMVHRLPVPLFQLRYTQPNLSVEERIALVDNYPKFRHVLDKMPKINIVLLVGLRESE